MALTLAGFLSSLAGNKLTSIGNLLDAWAYYSAGKGGNIPANGKLIAEMKADKSFSVNRFGSDGTATKIIVAKAVESEGNRVRNKAYPDNICGLKCWTMGSYAGQVEYDFVPHVGDNVISVRLHGSDTWDFNLRKDDVIYNIKTVSNKILADFGGMWRGAVFDITFDFTFDLHVNVPYINKPVSRSCGTVAGPSFPLPNGHYYGPRNGPIQSVSGIGCRNDGITGDGLRQWQARMKDRGWPIGVDGKYGAQTEKVVRQFQTEKGLFVDGLINPTTWAAAWTTPVT